MKSGPLPLPADSSIETAKAPVAQLDRALPSEAGRFAGRDSIKHLLDQGSPRSMVALLH
jgi:hypothetical protein